MRKVIAALVFALCLAACGLARPDVQFHRDLNNNTNCQPERFVVGELVAEQTLVIRDDQGEITDLIWPGSFSLEWVPGFVGGHFDVLDDTGAVVAATGRRYSIGGQDFIAAAAFWACGPITPL